MKPRTIIPLLIAACLTLTAITSCNGDKHGRQITGYRELTVTVASTKLPGVVFSCGNNYLTDVYAVKTENSDEWEQLDAIARFDYEEGNEYCLRISKTDYLDYEMGEPAWTNTTYSKSSPKSRRPPKTSRLTSSPNGTSKTIAAR